MDFDQRYFYTHPKTGFELPKGFVYDAHEETMILEDEIENEFISDATSKILRGS